jgi:hypothetical protein
VLLIYSDDIQALSLEKVTEPLIVVSLHISARRPASGVERQDTSPVPVRYALARSKLRLNMLAISRIEGSTEIATMTRATT